ncbi:replication initiator protein A (plasmid) [Lentilactobacillus buchneri]|uniref:replication initiator protein A n=1 Tax=Lentilactobacillus buchneri TaxID=1581 RepID=UPI0034E502EF
MQFFKVKESNLNSDLKGGNEILIYSLLEDRMQASTKNKDFFSKKFNDYYVIYTRDELAMKLGVNVSTITEVFKRLVKKGYLVMKHQFNGATKLFLPKFENETSPEANNDNVKREIQRPEIGKPNSSRTPNSNKQITDNTDDTCSRTNSLKDSNLTQKPDQNKVIKQAELDVIANSLVTKVHLPKQAVNIMKTFSFGDPKKLYSYAGLLFKAKSAVSKQAQSIQNAQEALSFELNTDYQETLDTDLKRIIVSANKKTSQPEGYMMTSLMDMFQNKVNDYCSHDVQSVIS